MGRATNFMAQQQKTGQRSVSGKITPYAPDQSSAETARLLRQEAEAAKSSSSTKYSKTPKKQQQQPTPKKKSKKGKKNKVERKTPGAVDNNRSLPPVTVTAKRSAPLKNVVDEKNILHKFRSFTYNFTLAALPPDASNKKEKIIAAVSQYAIIKSSGKAVNEIQSSAPIVEGFNDSDYGSPGRFDMFLNNVEIETLMSFTEKTNMTMATRFSFEVFEPYSINGFMEALQVSAEAAGNANYQVSSYVLKVEFLGYADNEKGPSEILVREKEQGTRYFVIMITKVEAKMDEQGTKYSVKAIARNELGFSDENALKEDIQVSGSTVVEICQDLMDSLNIASIEAAKREYRGVAEKHADQYEIVFPTPDWGDQNTFDYTKTYDKFANAKLIVEEPSIFTFYAPGDVNSGYGNTDGSAPGTMRNAGDVFRGGQAGYDEAGTKIRSNGMPGKIYDPSVSSALFGKGTRIHDAIAAIIRDSSYTKDIFRKEPKEVIEDQMIEYFHIAVEVDVKNPRNEFTGSPVYIYRYIVYPYKIHFSRVPIFQELLSPSDQNELVKLYSRRKYSYLYTGKNVDIRTFNITFNHLYFQAYPRTMNNRPLFANGNSDGYTNNTEKGKRLAPVTTATNSKRTQLPVSPRVSDIRRSVSSVGPGGNANKPNLDTYDALVKNMHQAILDNISMIKVEMEILGDPYYLCTGGIGNPRPKLVDETVTENGEAPYQINEIIVQLEFRNPIDIDTFPNGGLVKFDRNRVPFNGCYKVIKVNSRFSDGLFTQRLHLLRIPGEPIIESSTSADQPSVAAVGPKYQFLEDAPVDQAPQPEI